MSVRGDGGEEASEQIFHVEATMILISRPAHASTVPFVTGADESSLLLSRELAGVEEDEGGSAV
jgi:hypothetical protein